MDVYQGVNKLATNRNSVYVDCICVQKHGIYDQKGKNYHYNFILSIGLLALMLYRNIYNVLSFEYNNFNNMFYKILNKDTDFEFKTQ